MAEILRFALDYLRDSPLLKACLSESQLSELPSVIGDAQNHDWDKVKSADRIEKLL